MNFVKNISLIALATLAFASCKKTDKEAVTQAPAKETVANSTESKGIAANLETASFKIEGMTCPMGCAATIEQKLSGMEGVKKAKVDFDSKTATISFDPAKQTAENFVKTVEKIADGAYKVSDVKSSGDKAYFDAAGHNKDKKKKKKAAKAAGSKKGGCCAAGADAKKSCHETKGGSM